MKYKNFRLVNLRCRLMEITKVYPIFKRVVEAVNNECRAINSPPITSPEALAGMAKIVADEFKHDPDFHVEIRNA